MVHQDDAVGAVLEERGGEGFDAAAQQHGGQRHAELVGEHASLAQQLEGYAVEGAFALFGIDPHAAPFVEVDSAGLLLGGRDAQCADGAHVHARAARGAGFVDLRLAFGIQRKRAERARGGACAASDAFFTVDHQSHKMPPVRRVCGS